MKNFLLKLLCFGIVFLFLVLCLQFKPHNPSASDSLGTLRAIKVDSLGSLSSSQLSDIAKNDLLITDPGSQNKASIDKLKQLNPQIKIYGYQNVVFVSGNDATTARSNNWILKDSSGNDVYTTDFPTDKMGDIGNPSFRSWKASQIYNAIVNVANVSGVFADWTSAFIITGGGGINTRPINPRTGLAYTDLQWRDDMLALVTAVKDKIGRPYLGNGPGLLQGCGNHGFYATRDLTDPLIARVDGVMLEGFIKWDGEGWRSPTEWNQDLQYLTYLNSLGKITLAWTITYGSQPTGSTMDQLSWFGYGTYLLARSDTNQYFCAVGNENGFYNANKVSVGYPLENYHIRSDSQVYQRGFSNALILVNPTSSDVLLQLGTNYKTLTGQVVSTITVPKYNGMMLLK